MARRRASAAVTRRTPSVPTPLISRILAARCARVTGIDLSPRLVEMARDQQSRMEESAELIEYRVEDLSAPFPVRRETGSEKVMVEEPGKRKPPCEAEIPRSSAIALN
ncbi:MAG: class I SAM-dependent methyltransferase [Chloroflexi bacterium]|nr:MAG: class I SAM-dependent methyltransferase [Chloroflexota bacterium]